MSDERRVEVGRVVRPHGLRGEVRVQLHNPDSNILCDVGTVWLERDSMPGQALAIVSSRPIGRQTALLLEGISDRSRAEDLVGARVLVPRERLPELEEDEYYHVDLAGLEVRDKTGRSIGVVQAVYPTGAHDVFVIDGGRGQQWLVPAVERFVARVDVPAGIIIVDNLDDLAGSKDSGNAV